MSEEGVKFIPHPLGLDLLQWAERNELVRLLAINKGCVAAVAEQVPMGRQTVYSRIKVLKITPEDWAKATPSLPADHAQVCAYLENRVCKRPSPAGIK